MRVLAAGAIALALTGSPLGAQAQSAGDTLLYSIVDDAGSSEALFRSSDGKLIFRRNSQGGGDARGDTTFYVRETWPINAMTKVTLDDSFDTVDDIVITVSTAPDAIHREHKAGGEIRTSQRSEEVLEFPRADGATAHQALATLKSLAGL